MRHSRTASAQTLFLLHISNPPECGQSGREAKRIPASPLTTSTLKPKRSSQKMSTSPENVARASHGEVQDSFIAAGGCGAVYRVFSPLMRRSASHTVDPENGDGRGFLAFDVD